MGGSLVPPAFLREGTETFHPPRPSFVGRSSKSDLPPRRVGSFGSCWVSRETAKKNMGPTTPHFLASSSRFLASVNELNNKIPRHLTHPLTFPQLSTSSDRPKTKAQYMVYGRLTSSLQRRILNRCFSLRQDECSATVPSGPRHPSWWVGTPVRSTPKLHKRYRRPVGPLGLGCSMAIRGTVLGANGAG